MPTPQNPKITTTERFVAYQVSKTHWVIYTKKGDDEAKALAIKTLKLAPYVAEDGDVTFLQTLQK